MENKIDILIGAKDQASKTIEKVNWNVKKMSVDIKKVGLVSWAAFWVIALGAKNAIDAFAESEVATARVNAILGTMWEKGKQAKSSIDALAKSHIQLGFDDEDTAESMAKLLQRTGDLTEATKLNAVAMDLARAKNIDLSTATTLVWQVLSWNGKVLKQYGIDIKDSATPLEALWELQTKVAGQASAFADTYAGKMQTLNTQIGNIKETIWGPLSEALTSVLAKFTPILEKVATWIEANPKLTANMIMVAGAVTGLVSVLAWLSLVLPAIISGISALGAVIAFMTWPIGLVILAVGALYLAWKNNFLGMQTATKVSMDFMENTVWVGVYNIQQSLTTFYADAMVWNIGFLNDLGAWWYDTWQGIKANLSNVLTQIVEAGRSSFTQFKTIVTGIVTEVWTYVTAKLNAIKDTLREIVSLGKAKTDTFNGNAVAGARASGGPVSGGSTYLVGERWPELFTPASSGNITPNNQLGGVSVSINMWGVSVRNESDINSLASAVADQLTRSLQLSKLGIS